MTTTALAQHLTALQPVSQALQRRATHAPQDPITALTRRLDLATYRAILAYPWWTLIRQAIVDTRSHDQGLAAGVQLFWHSERFRHLLPPHEIEQHVISLGFFVLDMLDRLDDWEGFLATWDLLRTQTVCAVIYEPAALAVHGQKLEPFILAGGVGTLRVHFLYLTLWRKAVIERKLARKRLGGKLGNMWHATQAELSDAEIRRRLQAVAARVREAVKEAQPWG